MFNISSHQTNENENCNEILTKHMLEEIGVTDDLHGQWKYKRTNWKLKTTKQTERSGSSPENV